MNDTRLGQDYESSGNKGFLMYVPNSVLGFRHVRDSWTVLPSSFQSLGFSSTLVCGSYDGPSLEGVHVVQTRMGIETPIERGRKGSWIRTLFEPFLAFREIVQKRPRVVLIGPVSSSLISILPLAELLKMVCRFKKTSPPKFILKLDWSFDYSNLGVGAISTINALVALSSRIFDVVSVETTCGFTKAGKVPFINHRKMKIVPIGYAQNSINIVHYEAVPRDPTILCVGRIARMKGQNVLIKAFSEIVASHPEWKLKFVGPVEDFEYLSELKALVEELGLSGKAVFLGQVSPPSLDLLYKQSSVFCLPSILRESAGNVKYQATAFGLPVVTTSIPCRIDDENNGWFVVEPGDAGELGTCLDKLVASETCRKAAVERAQSVLRSYLDRACEYVALIEEAT